MTIALNATDALPDRETATGTVGWGPRGAWPTITQKQLRTPHSQVRDRTSVQPSRSSWTMLGGALDRREGNAQQWDRAAGKDSPDDAIAQPLPAVATTMPPIAEPSISIDDWASRHSELVGFRGAPRHRRSELTRPHNERIECFHRWRPPSRTTIAPVGRSYALTADNH